MIHAGPPRLWSRCASARWILFWALPPAERAGFLAVIDKYKGVEDSEYLLAGLARCYRFNEADISELRSVLCCQGEAEENAAIAEIQSAYQSLQTAFSAATSIDTTSSRLELAVGYHDSEGQGCRGDEDGGEAH
jgi:hypothetical protein